MSDKNSLWNSAARAGIVLGGVSILYLLLTMLTGYAGLGNKAISLLVSVLNAILWIAKFGACIYLMRLFMLKFSDSNPDADNSRVFKFGMATALLSALVYSAFYFAYVMFIAPDTFSEAMSVLDKNPMFDANTRDMLDQIKPMMPTYSFFVNLIYCWLYGTVLSAILSSNIPPKNPFKDHDNSSIDEQ